MKKTPPIPVDMKIRIARHKEKNKSISYRELAEFFNVQYDQARNAHKEYLSGKYNKGKKSPKKNIESALAEKSPEEIFDSQFHTALAELEANKDLNAFNRISALEKLSKIHKTNQSIKLVGHIKRADADVIAAIVRRYEPDASDDTVIKIYREEIEKLKSAE